MTLPAVRAKPVVSSLSWAAPPDTGPTSSNLALRLGDKTKYDIDVTCMKEGYTAGHVQKDSGSDRGERPKEAILAGGATTLSFARQSCQLIVIG